MGASHERLNHQTPQNMGSAFPLILVGGMSGAGKSTVLDVFEDMRFFAVDGLPATLVEKMVGLFSGQNQLHYRGMALGMFFRNQDFPNAWLEAIAELRRRGFAPQIVFMEARNDILVKRYSQTRRPHPLSQMMQCDATACDLSLEQAIVMERERLFPLRNMADVVIDTSDFSIHDLRKRVQERWAGQEEGIAGLLNLQLISFGFKYGLPSEADLVFDLRFLPNPYFVEAMRPLTGQNPDVAAYVLDADPGRTFLVKLQEFLQYLLPLYQAEGRYRLTIAIGCTGGRHRSVAVSEALFATLKESQYGVSLEHRHVELG